MTLVEFLLARIADDEQRVRKFGVISGSLQMPAVFARLLAECGAKRAIISLCAEAVMDPNLSPPGLILGVETLRALGLPYADHPDFRETWTS